MNRNKTPISDLIDLDADERMGDGVRSLIRPIDTTIGMRQSMNGNYMPVNQYGNPGPQRSTISQMGDILEPIPVEMPQAPKQIEYTPSHLISCPNVMEHIQNCPICSKLYNQDKTLYLIVIALMGIVILILTKKILEK